MRHGNLIYQGIPLPISTSSLSYTWRLSLVLGGSGRTLPPTSVPAVFPLGYTPANCPHPKFCSSWTRFLPMSVFYRRNNN